MTPPARAVPTAATVLATPTWDVASADGRDSRRRDSDLPQGTVVRGRYRIDGVLGRGGMSTVYAAHDVLLDRDVALKVFEAGPDAGVRALQPEARVVAALSHPALTAVFDAGLCRVATGREVGFLVLERVAGGDLRAFLRAGRMSWPDTASLGVDLADGLAHVHAAGYVHCDVKPANVLVVGRDGHGRIRAKITDFGIAARATAAAPAESTVGTAAYISPEQVRGAAASPRSDVYALGLVLLETLTGVVEYPGPAEQSAVARLRRDAVIPDAIPGPLASLLRTMTRSAPDDRPSAAEVAERLTALEGIHRSAAVRTAPLPVVAEQQDVLTWPPERAFDAATALAARMLRVPHACVVLHASGAARLTSTVGLRGRRPSLPDPCWLADRSAVRPWAVPDLLHDPRTADDGFVRQTGVRAFAGAPLVDEAGEAQGLLCVFHDEPRPFDALALADLAELASLVARELALRIAVRRAVFSR